MISTKTKYPFQFCTRFHLSESMGLKVSTIAQFLSLLKEGPGSSIKEYMLLSLALFHNQDIVYL